MRVQIQKNLPVLKLKICEDFYSSKEIGSRVITYDELSNWVDGAAVKLESESKTLQR